MQTLRPHPMQSQIVEKYHLKLSEKARTLLEMKTPKSSNKMWKPGSPEASEICAWQQKKPAKNLATKA